MDLSPQRASYSEVLPGERIRKSPRWDNEEGVAATVGTIMALLVFLSFFGIFTNQFVPVWMSDNESAHMSEAMEQFLRLKSDIDGLITDYPNSLVAPTPIVAPIKLSSAGIPVFAAPTAGILSLTPGTVYISPSLNVSYTYLRNSSTPMTLDSSNDGHTGGCLELYCPNRYYVEQSLVYEGGAVIVNQSEGEFIVAGIQMEVKNLESVSGTNRELKMTQVSLVGLNKTIGGTGSKLVYANLLYADIRPYQNPDGSTVTIEIVTEHSFAWTEYFGRVLNSSLADLDYGTDFTISRSPASADNFEILTVTITDIGVFNHARAVVQFSVGELGV